MFRLSSSNVFQRGLLFVLFAVTVILISTGLPLQAQLCTGTSPPCVLTAGYAGPAADANFNSRQAINQYETTLTPTSVGTLGTVGDFFEVDDSASALPAGAVSNPIMAQPLYVAGMNLGTGSGCNPCNMLIAVTLNSTIFAWVADGQQNSNQNAPGFLL